MNYYQERGLEVLRSMVMLASEGLKALMLVNGGAIVALLALLGSEHVATGKAASRLAFPFLCFSLGLASNLFGFLGAYWTQYALLREERTERGDTRTPPLEEGSHVRYLRLTALLSIVSIIFFVLGAFASIGALESVK